jgi:hypothetical protein
MTWILDQKMTEWARGILGDEGLVVKRRGGQYLLEGTPYGRVEVLSLSRKGHFLVAAQTPPREIPESEISEEIRDHLRRHGLRLWKYETGATVSQILSRLRDPEGSRPARNPVVWSPLTQPMTGEAPVVGEDRTRTVELLMALVSTTGPQRPIPVLSGPAGVGRHTITAAVVRRLNKCPTELPLARLMVPRALQTPCELLMDTLVTGRSYLTADDLLVVSDAALLRHLPSSHLSYFLSELSSLPHVLLLSVPGQLGPGPQCTCLNVVGLSDSQDIEELLRFAMPGFRERLRDSTFEMICCAAAVPGLGVLPGRLLYLMELA